MYSGLSCAIIILAFIFKTANQWCPHLLQWGVIDVLWIITAGSSQGLQDHIFLQRWKKILKGTKGPKKTSKERNEAKQTWPVYSRTELTQPHKRLYCFCFVSLSLHFFFLTASLSENLTPAMCMKSHQNVPHTWQTKTHVLKGWAWFANNLRC